MSPAANNVFAQTWLMPVQVEVQVLGFQIYFFWKGEGGRRFGFVGLWVSGLKGQRFHDFRVSGFRGFGFRVQGWLRPTLAKPFLANISG